MRKVKFPHERGDKKYMTEIDKVKLAKFKAICENPVLWAKAFLRTVDNATKKVGPWTARWYQAEMLLDNSDKKVARCGRRCRCRLPDDDEHPAGS